MSRRNVPRSSRSVSSRLQAGFVALVGLSSGLMALFGGGTVLVVGLSVLAGLVVGASLLWYVRWITS
ncbi:hypothetical protein EL22_20940 [Halostagnicola sp. A56]|nr:hypothetical protein EL22_20940 [Halostagnicola sp. A56]